MAAFEPADHLRSRTFLGLLVAQFLAAFNDQAIHASAMFFAINQGTLDEAQAISLMPILFYAPWALFCTLAGYLADRYSKRSSLVAWKFAEILITGIALLGFWLGTEGYRSGPWLVLSTVFFMGMHSAFFVPAKYGAMPEILSMRMLSRGNGLLESFSFLAIILGTVFGGVLSDRFRGQEYVIGVILLGLALIGAVSSLLLHKMPAAAPDRAFPPYLYRPLWDNIRVIVRSRPLSFAVLGIAFFTFIVAFMRATVYMHGESQVPRWSESQTSEVVGMVALGIGLGSPLVGFLSGGRVELGLLPIGAIGMIVATVVAAIFLQMVPGLIACIILIGFFTGFYIVPLFTLLQHRAPKTSKGDFIATSNFVNVTGAILASLVFFGMDWAARQTGLAPPLEQHPVLGPSGKTLVRRIRAIDYRDGRPSKVILGRDLTELETGDADTIEVGEGRLIDAFKTHLQVGDKVIESVYQRGSMTHHRLSRQGDPRPEVYDKHNMPRLLFLSAGGMTLMTLLLLWWQMPDLFLRTRLWFRWQRTCRLEAVGLHHLPAAGPAILAMQDANATRRLQVVSATDRLTRFLTADKPEPMEAALQRGEVIGLSLGENGSAERILERTTVPVVPVWVEEVNGMGKPKVYVVFGSVVSERSSAATSEAVRQTGDEFRKLHKSEF